MIAILIFCYVNRSQIIYEDFNNKKKKIIIRTKPTNKKISRSQNIVVSKSSNKPIIKNKIILPTENIVISNNKPITKNKIILPPQNIVLDKSRNKEYTNAEEVRTNNYYKLLMKDKVETRIRNNSEKKECITHIKPNIKQVINQYGYSYLPPEVWSVPQDRPPVCIPQVGFKAEALPMYTVGTPIDALEISNTILPKFTYNEVYDPKYYYPGYQSK